MLSRLATSGFRHKCHKPFDNTNVITTFIIQFVSGSSLLKGEKQVQMIPNIFQICLNYFPALSPTASTCRFFLPVIFQP